MGGRGRADTPLCSPHAPPPVLAQCNPLGSAGPGDDALGLATCLLDFFVYLLFWLLWVFVAAHRLSPSLQRSVAALGCGAWALTAVAFLVVECGFGGTPASVVATLGLSSAGSGVVGQAVRGIFLDQGLNPCPLSWQADSYPLCHQGNPSFLADCSGT